MRDRAETAPGNAAGPRAKRILIVEDNELNMRLLHDVLESQGHVILQAGSGAVAVKLARECGPDLILMDIQLPDVPGTEVTRSLRQDPLTRDIAIIAVTAFAMAGDEQRILASGCDAYVSKPVSLSELLATIELFLSRVVD